MTTTTTAPASKLSVIDEMLWGTPAFVLGLNATMLSLMASGAVPASNTQIVVTGVGLSVYLMIVSRWTRKNFTVNETTVMDRVMMALQPAVLAAILLLVAVIFLNTEDVALCTQLAFILAPLVPVEMALILRANPSRFNVQRVRR